MTERPELFVNEQANSILAEAYRSLRTNILYSKANRDLKSVLVTSSGPGEGKSAVVANAAAILAHSGKKVIVIDGDLRRPTQHHIWGCEEKGLTDVLRGEAELSSVLQPTAIDQVRLLACGSIPPNPSELLGSTQMREVLSLLRSKADYVLIDSPPILAVTDACVWAHVADGTILVLGAGSVRPEMARNAKEMLERAGGALMGVIINRVKPNKEHLYYNYYTANS